MFYEGHLIIFELWLQNLAILMLNHLILIEQLIITYITHYE